MTGKELFLQGLFEATTIVDSIRPSDLPNRTAIEWDVHTLAEHMLRELSWVPDMVQGRAIAQVGSKHDAPLKDDLLAIKWHTAADAARQAVEQANPNDIAHVSSGDVTVDEYLYQAGFELLIHAWDLGQGVTTEVHFTDDVAQAAYDYAVQHIAEWQRAGLFAETVATTDASIQVKLLALTGRSVSPTI